MKEKDIQKEIMNMLLIHPAVAWGYITTVGTVKGVHGGRPFSVGFPGQSDIMGQLKDGRLFAIEVKVPGKTPTDEQNDFITTVNNSHGVAGWADNVEDARRIIDEACVIKQ